jgi:hypothetical protein
MKNQFYIKAMALFIFCSGFTAPFSTTQTVQHTSGTAVIPAVDGFTFFRTHRQGNNGITATWGFTATGSVLGFKVERTYEDPADPYANWDIIAVLPFSNERSYKCTESGVFPGFITYRVRTMMANGSEVISPLSTVHIVSHR